MQKTSQQLVVGKVIQRASLPPAQLAQRQGQTASNHRAGHSAGFHPEDTPYLSGTMSHRQQVTSDEVDEDDSMYSTRTKSSARVYNRPIRSVQVAPPQTQVTEDLPAPRRVNIGKFFQICLLVMILGMLIALIINMFILPAVGRWNDDRVYGYPRISKAVANVGHGDSNHPDSQFIAINNNGVINIVELSYGNRDQKTARVYFITALSGTGSDLVPITSLQFSDENGDGKTDMVIDVGNTQYIMYNDGKQFQPHP